MNVPRWLSPKTNPAFYTALASIAVSVWQAIQVDLWRGSLTLSEVGRVAAPIVVAALVAWQRGKTTPLADPRDGNGNSLLPSPPVTVAVSSPGTTPAQVIAAIRSAVHAVPGVQPHTSQDDVTRAFVKAQLPAVQPPAQPPAGTKP